MASRRGYLTQTELANFADITITDSTEADDQISQAEEIIDAYVGPQEKFFDAELIGKAQSGSTTGFLLQSNHITGQNINYYKDCEAQIIGGTGLGQSKKITASAVSGQITTEAFTVALDNTTVYRIVQIGKFPRTEDTRYESEETETWYKWIPEMVKRAVAAQVQYMIEMGDKFFSTDASKKTAESIGDYSYQKDSSSASIENLIAPKAKQFLKGVLNRKGSFA